MGRGERMLLSFPAWRIFSVLGLLLVLVLIVGAVTNEVRRDRKWERFQAELSGVEISPSLDAEIKVLCGQAVPDKEQVMLVRDWLSDLLVVPVQVELYVESSGRLWKCAYGHPERIPFDTRVGGLGNWSELKEAGQRRFRRSKSHDYFEAYLPVAGSSGKLAIHAFRWVRG